MFERIYFKIKEQKLRLRRIIAILKVKVNSKKKGSFESFDSLKKEPFYKKDKTKYLFFNVALVEAFQKLNPGYFLSSHSYIPFLLVDNKQKIFQGYHQ